MTIFVHDEKGRMVKGTQATVDVTFLGPDALAELVAMHLHRLGAAEAASVTFVADGAPWIWDRIPAIVRSAKLDRVTVHEVLDCCHAAHHISLALAALGMKDRERMPAYREYRTLLRNGQWQRVVDELTEFAESSPGNERDAHGDRLLEKAWRSRPPEVPDLSGTGRSYRQRCRGEQHSPRDQSASQRQRHLLA